MRDLFVVANLLVSVLLLNILAFRLFKHRILMSSVLAVQLHQEHNVLAS